MKKQWPPCYNVKIKFALIFISLDSCIPGKSLVRHGYILEEFLFHLTNRTIFVTKAIFKVLFKITLNHKTY